VNALDIGLLLLVLVSVIAGFASGLARVVIGLFATILAVILAFWFYGIPAAWFARWFDRGTVASILGFLAVFAGVVALGSLLSWAVSRILKFTGLSVLDRLAGGAFGVVRGAAAVAAVVAILLAFTPKPRPGWIVESRVVPYAVDAAEVFTSLAPYRVRQAFRAGVDEVRKAWKKPRKLDEVII
jgi:membrane protein required for colicin V production